MTSLCKSAVADWCGAAQLHPSSSAAVEVVNQLGHWGNFASMCLFFQGIQGCLRDGGVASCDGLEDRLRFWLSAGGCIARVSIKMKCMELSSLQKQACVVGHKLPLTQHH